MKKAFLLSALLGGLCASALSSLAQTTTNNPGVPIFGAGGTSSGLQFVFVNGLGTLASPPNFDQANAFGIVNSSGATNAAGSRVAFLSDHTTNWITPEQFGALGGANNDTAAFSNMVAYASTNSPGYAILIRNRSYSVSNLVVPNNVFILGNNATISEIPGMTNFLVDASSATNVTISGIIFKGTNFSALSGRTLQTDSGIKLNQLGGNRLENCSVWGFGGYSVYVAGTDTGSGGWDLPLSSISKCLFYSNYYGPAFLSFASPDIRGEYISVVGIESFENVVGIRPEAGNLMVSASRFTGNSVGVLCQSGTQNGEHASFSGDLINHNAQSMSLTGVANGEFFDGCWIAADGGGGIGMTNCAGVSFNQCFFDPMTITSSGGTTGWNTIKNSEYAGTFGISLLFNNLDGRLVFSDNHSRDNLTADWSHKYSIPITSGNFGSSSAGAATTQSPSPMFAYNYVSWTSNSLEFQVYKVPRWNSTNALITLHVQSITNQIINLVVDDVTYPASGQTAIIFGGVNYPLTIGDNTINITNTFADSTSPREVTFIWSGGTNTTTYLLSAEIGE